MGKVTWTKDQEEYLKELYRQKNPVAEIVKKMNDISDVKRTYGAITSKAQHLGLVTSDIIRPNNPNFKAMYQDYDWCYQKFVEEGLTHREMANICNCTVRTIKKWCTQEHRIDLYLRMHVKQLSEVQKDLIIGSLLGDGHIDKRDKYPLFIVSHAENQKEYLYYKYDILKNLCEMTPRRYSGKQNCEIVGSICDCQDFYRFNTRTYDALRPLRGMSQIELMSSLNEYSLSIWMLDDGYCGSKGYWELCAPFDSQDERDFLVRTLKEKFGILPVVEKDNRYFRFHAEDSITITEIILRNIPGNLDIIQTKIYSRHKYQNLDKEDLWDNFATSMYIAQ